MTDMQDRVLASRAGAHRRVDVFRAACEFVRHARPGVYTRRMLTRELGELYAGEDDPVKVVTACIAVGALEWRPNSLRPNSRRRRMFFGTGDYARARAHERERERVRAHAVNPVIEAPRKGRFLR